MPNWDMVIAGLTIASGIFLAGRQFGKLEEKVDRQDKLEQENEQLERLKQLFPPEKSHSDSEK